MPKINFSQIFKGREKERVANEKADGYPKGGPVNIASITGSQSFNTGVMQTTDNGNEPHQGSIGVTGTQVFGGFEAEDPNPKLQNRYAYIAFDNMERIDANVYGAVQRSRDKIKSADYFLEPKDDKDEEQARRAEIASDCFFNKQEKIWLDNMNDILTYFRGHAVFEPVWHVIDYPGEGKMWTIRKLGYKSQKTLWQWFLNDDNVMMIRQIAYGDDSRYVDIPGKYLLIFSYNREGNILWGRSPMRSMYGPAERKENYLRTALQGIKANAKGVLDVEVPDIKINSDEYNNLQTALSNFWRGFTNWITHPKGWTLKHEKMDFDAQGVKEMMSFENMEIGIAGGNDQSQLGQSTRGAQGLHKGKQEESNVTIKVQAKYICQKLQTIINDFYLFNWGPAAVPAELKFTGIDNKADFEEAQKDQILAQIDPSLTQDPIYKAWLRKKYEIPGGDEIEEAGETEAGGPDDGGKNPAPTDDKESAAVADEAAEHGGTIKEIAKDATQGKVKPVKAYAKEIVKAHEKEGKLKEGESCDCGHAHDAPMRLSDFSRKLTKYENKIQLSEIAANINNFSAKYNEEIQNSFKNYIIPKYKRDLQAALSRAVTDTQKYNAVIDTGLSNKDKVKLIIKNMITEQVSRGYVGAKKELTKKKLSDAELPAGAYGWCGANSEILTDTFFNDAIKKLRLSAIASIDNEKTPEQVAFDAGEELENHISDVNNIGAQYISVKALNEGRFNAFQEAKEEIQGFQFSAILETACPLCAELDGKTFKIDDPDSTEYQPPLHANCNCILIPILMDEEAPEKWDGLDESVSDKNEKFKKLSEVK